jgi:hypothetical protein
MPDERYASPPGQPDIGTSFLLHSLLREHIKSTHKDHDPYDPKSWPIISEQIINTALGTEYQGLQDLPPCLAYTANIFAKYIIKYPQLVNRCVTVKKDEYLPYLFIHYPLNYSIVYTQAIKPTPTILDLEHNVWTTYFRCREQRMAGGKTKAVASVAQSHNGPQNSALKTDKFETSGEGESVSADAAYMQTMKLLDENIDTFYADKKKLKQITTKLAKERKRAMNTMIKVAMLDAKLEEHTKRADTAEAKIAELNGTLKANIAERDAVFKVSQRILQEYRDQESRMKDQSAQVNNLKKRAETFENGKATAEKKVAILEENLLRNHKEYARMRWAFEKKVNEVITTRKELENKDEELKSAKQDIVKYKQQVLDIYNKMNKSSQPETSISASYPTKRKFNDDTGMSDKDSAAKKVKIIDLQGKI